ncbi:hypothetical protein [Pseudoflavonifractor phocaeensis]|uniref:hypothetical protein n=1 Tax=Pseudoflavonifractor phocaeensis TaxID=1870988 RepID=UPI001F468A81|nr:hypothetical protein [Pseudoflavonifractor phocaeensis]MCF2661473.1 hypothetical protein [Pseudoflavonifractor phocaeensis]
MELKIMDGDYVPNGAGGLCRLSGSDEVLGRVLYRLTARRGGLPFLPQLGSRLHLILRERPSARQAMAAQYVAEALEAEPDLQVAGVELTDRGEQAELTVRLNWRGEALSVTLSLT